MQSRSANSVAESAENDVYTVKLTCNDATLCGTEVYTATSVYTSYGQYSVTLEPTESGTYDVLITMENAYTDAQEIPIAYTMSYLA